MAHVHLWAWRTGAPPPLTLSLSDAISSTDVISRAFAKPLLSSLSAVDARSSSLNRTFAESAAISDARNAAVSMTVVDTVSLAPTIYASYALLHADTLTGLDSLVRALYLTRNDSTTLSSSFSRTVSFLRSLADTLSSQDNASRAASYLRDLADSYALSDAPSLRPTVRPSDLLTLTEEQRFVVTKALVDSLHATQLVDREVQFLRTLLDSLSIADAKALLPLLQRGDSATLSDATTRHPRKVVVDTVSSSDVLYRAVVKLRTDAAVLVDTNGKAFSASLSDSISAASAIGKLLHKVQTAGLTLSDVQAKEIDARVVDILTNSDEKAKDVDYHVLDDVVLLIDHPSVRPTLPLADGVALSDGYTLSVLRDATLGPKAALIRRIHPRSKFSIMVSATALRALYPTTGLTSRAAFPIAEGYKSSPTGTLREVED